MTRRPWVLRQPAQQPASPRDERPPTLCPKIEYLHELADVTHVLHVVPLHPSLQLRLPYRLPRTHSSPKKKYCVPGPALGWLRSPPPSSAGQCGSQSGGASQPGRLRPTAARVWPTSGVVAPFAGGHWMCSRQLRRVQPSSTRPPAGVWHRGKSWVATVVQPFQPRRLVVVVVRTSVLQTCL